MNRLGLQVMHQGLAIGVVRPLFYLGVVVGCLIWSRPCPADPLSSMLPADTIGFVELTPAEHGAETGSLVQTSVEALNAAGALPPRVSWLLNLCQLAAVAGEKPSCLGWAGGDITVNFHTGALSVHALEFIWIIDVGGEPREPLDRLTTLLAQISSKQTARQQVRSLGDAKYIEFTDTRWPAWAKLDWTQQGRYLVFTLGQGVMERYLRQKKVELPWMKFLKESDEAALKQGLSGEVSGRVYLSLQQMRDRWPDAMKVSKLSILVNIMDGQMCDAVGITARAAGREVRLYGASLQHGVTSTTPWTVPLARDSPLLGMVPKGADYYLVLKVNWPLLYERVIGTIGALEEESNPGGARKQIARFPALFGVDLQRDIIDQMSPLVLVHNAPQAPLRLPLLVSVIAAAEPGKETAVQSAMQKLMDAATRALSGADGSLEMALTPQDPSAPRLVQEQGMTYLQYVLRGPAWKWLGRRLAISWSPPALRDIVRQMENSGELPKAGDPFSLQSDR